LKKQTSDLEARVKEVQLANETAQKLMETVKQKEIEIQMDLSAKKSLRSDLEAEKTARVKMLEEITLCKTKLQEQEHQLSLTTEDLSRDHQESLRREEEFRTEVARLTDANKQLEGEVRTLAE